MIKVDKGNIAFKGDVDTLQAELTLLLKNLFEQEVLDVDELKFCIGLALEDDEVVHNPSTKNVEMILEHIKDIFAD